MPITYAQKKGSVLAQRLEEYENVEDTLSCREELFLQQSVLQDKTEEYADALESGDKQKKVIWGSLVSSQAKEVISSKEKMAKIEQGRSQHITRETLYIWVKSIGEMLFNAFPNEQGKVMELVAEIEGSVLGTHSTEVSEKELWSEMVTSVPLLEEEIV